MQRKIRKTCFFLFAVNNSNSQTEAFGVRRGFLGRSGVPGHDDGITVVRNLRKWKWSVNFLEKVERSTIRSTLSRCLEPICPLNFIFQTFRTCPAGWVDTKKAESGKQDVNTMPEIERVAE